MNKKLFTLLLLTVFVLAQFGMASAAPIAGATVTVAPLPTFSKPGDTGLLNYTLTLPGGPAQNVLVFWRLQPTNPWNALWCYDEPGHYNNLVSAAGSFTYTLGSGTVDQDIFEFLFVVVDTPDGASCGVAANLPSTATLGQASTFIDGDVLAGSYWNPPSLEVAGFSSLHVSCNTFELWGLVSDQYYNGVNWATDGYSGVNSWNAVQTGSFAPAPLGAGNNLLSWMITIPGSATGNWSFTIMPEDMVGNNWGAVSYFRNGIAVTADEKASCMNFTDVAGHQYETYVRYLGDLGLIAGNPDGSYGVNTTLTRAEASALFEKANGYTAGTLPVAPPSAACTFTDVSAGDWFAGWVWQACADGFMNGLGGGLFGPADLLTRGQIVTIFNNIHNMGGGSGAYLDFATYNTVLEFPWTGWWVVAGYPYLREAAFTDVPFGAFYVVPVERAYGIGVADGTSATTFSPDSPILRGEFAKMLYRALSRD
ncbi:MAG: S-layer homology domain-containing protein [Chloroflexi bacterium]|nr:S-layer homology domain-containing protein [Chloroflexota bacterium]